MSIKFEYGRKLYNRIPIRLHMTLMLMTTIGAGLLISKLLLYFNLESIAMRYSLSVMSSYAMFLVLIYFWLTTHIHTPFEVSQKSDSSANLTDDILDAAEIIDDLTDNRFSTRSGYAINSPQFTNSSSSLKSSHFFNLDLDDSEGGLIVLIILLIIAILGSSFYLVYQAPEILIEAAFEMALAGGLIRKAKEIKNKDGWLNIIISKTLIPFFIVLFLSWFLGSLIKSKCPEANSYHEYVDICKN